METTYTDLREGVRRDITVEFVSRRPLDCQDGRVHRLLVADQTGEQFALLVTPDRDPVLDLKTGGSYRVRHVLGCVPVDSKREVGRCPTCDGPLRSGLAVDTAGDAAVVAASRLGLDDVFGVVDAEAVVERVRDDATVDDWQPMTGTPSVDAPDYVCDSCSRTVDEYELRSRREMNDVQENYSADAEFAPMNSSMAAETVGLAAGGAKDVGNFRRNVENGYTPQPEAISDEGLFYDYHFETGTGAETDALFAPRYAAAVSDHPVTDDTEQYLSVGLDSTLSVEAFDRPRLDLVAVLDVSGSMDTAFDEYYYDEHDRKREVESDATTKLDAATQSLCALTEQLRDDDRLGVVLYNHRAHVAKPLRDVGTTDMAAIQRHVREIAAGGGTNLADGFEAAVDLLADCDSNLQVEQRVVFMTDMMPNVGTTEEDELTRLFADAAVDGVHTTFIGMGLDANAELADALSGIRGANHYFVHSAAEFERRLGEEFEYMVTPLVYDLTLELEADGYEIATVHGSPSSDAASDQLMHVGTLFPSPKQDGEARGGVVLVRLEQTMPNADIELVASWTERDGSTHAERTIVTVPDERTYAHSGIRKAVALARYARELRTWTRDVHDRADNATGVDDWLLPDQREQHERESVQCTVPGRYVARFEKLHAYLREEMAAVDDETLQRELDLLETLLQSATVEGSGMAEQQSKR